MKEQFRDYNPYSKNKMYLGRILEICDEYAADEISLTLRQIFYQMVSRGFTENTEKMYNKTKRIVGEARYGGLLDWDGIHDRTRKTLAPSEWENTTTLLNAALTQYRLPRTETQTKYIEVITEKDALHSVLSPIAEKYHLPFSVFRGYNSSTAMYALSKRILREDKPTVLLYIGDFDPSGLDMIRDIEERVGEFTHHAPFEVIPVALTEKQIEDERLIPNYIKTNDSRAKEYKERYGEETWEVDALRPELLREILTSNILKHLDLKRMNVIIEQEEKDKAFLREMLESKKEEKNDE
jgi:hypothetical protein